MKQDKIGSNPLINLTCIIPFRKDSRQRCRNLNAVVGYLNKLGCSIIVSESGLQQVGPQLITSGGTKCSFHFDRDPEPLFHRTRIINRVAYGVRTPLIALWDTDIVIPYSQLVWAAGQLLEKKSDFALPFDGRCVDFSRQAPKGCLSRSMRKIAFATIQPMVTDNSDDVITVILSGSKLVGRLVTRVCVGGAVLFRREVFMEGGMENEGIVSYGPEDQERVYRFRKLGFKECRVPGLLYHLAHPRGLNSDDGHPLSESNWAEFRRISKLSRQHLATEITRWSWVQDSALNIMDLVVVVISSMFLVII